MDTQLQVFHHDMFGTIRTMTDEKGETFFVGRDVAAALGYSNPRKALQDHVDSEDKGVTKRDTLGGAQADQGDKTTVAIRDTGSNYKSKAVVINESGLYSLILSSHLPQAKAFKRWVTSEVLPQIRKTGGYIPTRDAEGRELSPGEILQRAEVIVGRTLRLLNAPAENCLTATELIRILNLKDADELRSWLRLLIEKDIIISTNVHSKAKEYRVNPDILRGSEYKGKTSLKRIEDYRLKELILEDLKIYKTASLAEIQKRIGEEIPSKKIWNQLQKLVANGTILKIGKYRWQKYQIID